MKKKDAGLFEALCFSLCRRPKSSCPLGTVADIFITLIMASFFL